LPFVVGPRCVFGGSRLNLRIESLLAGARAAGGTTVIIDVFRASSSIVAAFGAGAERVIPAGELEAAYELKKRNPSFLLFGERGGLPPEGFDSGNSPPTIARMNLRGKTVILTTSAGTQGIVSAVGAEEILIGCFLNARAVAQYIVTKQPGEVCLVAMGVAGIEPSPEDHLCASYIRSLILGEPADYGRMAETIMQHPEAAKFLDEDSPLHNPEDVHFSLRANAYGLVPRYAEGEGLVVNCGL